MCLFYLLMVFQLVKNRLRNQLSETTLEILLINATESSQGAQGQIFCFCWAPLVDG